MVEIIFLLFVPFCTSKEHENIGLGIVNQMKLSSKSAFDGHRLRLPHAAENGLKSINSQH